MSDKVKKYRSEFLHEVVRVAEVNSCFTGSTFIELFTDELIEDELIDGFEPSYLTFETNRNATAQVDGYYYNEMDKSLYLYICEFYAEEKIKNLLATDIKKIFNKLKRFHKEYSGTQCYSGLEESTPIYDLAYILGTMEAEILKVNLVLITDATIADKVDISKIFSNKDLSLSYDIWDISRMYRKNASKLQKEDIILKFDELYEQPIYCLPAHLETQTYKSYLIVMPGEMLASLYAKYSSRLLEQNVRVYLQTRGKVNKGLKNTIIQYPEKFFAYNNGLTCTADDIELSTTTHGLKIDQITNLQIVNGGQTTASLYNALMDKNKKTNLSEVFVQMKLTVILDPKISKTLIPKISEYANTQNKVSATDFFSNHPFHVRMEDFSRRIYTSGQTRDTKWFYERARGQYKDAIAYLSTAERKKFELEYPNKSPMKQMLTKTDLAKYAVAWLGMPHILAKGAQESFMTFSKQVEKNWGEQGLSYTEDYYKKLIAKAITFRSLEKIISNASWYESGYRSQIVAYTLAMLDSSLKSKKLSVDFNKIWKEQKISVEMNKQLDDIAEQVMHILTNPVGTTHVGSWTKKEKCWTHVKKTLEDEIILFPGFSSELISIQEAKSEEKVAKKAEKQGSVNYIMQVHEIYEQGKWQHIYNFALDNLDTFPPNELRHIELGTKYPNKIPQEFQARKIMKAVSLLENIGLEIQ